jgi:hypothetical protein
MEAVVEEALDTLQIATSQVLQICSIVKSLVEALGRDDKSGVEKQIVLLKSRWDLSNFHRIKYCKPMNPIGEEEDPQLTAIAIFAVSVNLHLEVERLIREMVFHAEGIEDTTMSVLVVQGRELTKEMGKLSSQRKDVNDVANKFSRLAINVENIQSRGTSGQLRQEMDKSFS